MPKAKKPSVGGTLVGRAPQGSSNNTVAKLGSNIPGVFKAKTKAQQQQRLMPGFSVDTRSPAFLQMLVDPVNAQPALPPVSLPARAIPLKQYTEVNLSTDANGTTGMIATPLMANQYALVSTWTGTVMTTFAAGQPNAENTSFQQNFQYWIPLVMEVVVKYTGSMNSVAGRLYGIVGNGGVTDVTKFPLEPNGCEQITSDGLSCSWYSTSPVWANPCAASQTGSIPTEWMDCTIALALIGGPVSITNLLSVGIYMHGAGIPKAGVCGLTPMASLPDPSLQLVAGLFSDATHGVGVSSTSAKERERLRRRRAVLRDVVKIGGKVVGTLFPGAHLAVTAADILANALPQ